MSDSISTPEKSFPAISSGDDVCSICLEPFNITHDPPTVTNCKHEYHLQCILEWSQRSKECPICWQILALKDPTSQELFDAVANERILRSRIEARHINEHEDSPYVDASEFDEHVIRNFAAAASRLRHVNRRRRQRSAGIGPSQVHLSSPEDFQYFGSEPSQVNSEVYIPSAFFIDPTPPNMSPSAGNVVSHTIGTRDTTVEARQQSPGSPPSPNLSESVSFPESIKSKLSAASARYKDSFSKGTRGIKEKLLARNSSVKELSREVHREMSAGIAGVARMIERLDFASRKMGAPVPSSINDGGTTNLTCKGKGVDQSHRDTTGETMDDIGSDPIEVRPEVSFQLKN
ncbi:E3 ubiquitin-protein ligase RHF1A [Heracleum sosnowskyi]|uniref:RING-type E3 ubiquitin transferase n=1 Tax=Heracleum sosnowskyi TaxID=360622 RepID=A0AAD8MPL6_9APIA|nr:E3 ubiquitin-protein ligase RHF1A [Heracleum sosnowskyi]